MGLSGSGKSTLVRLINRLIEPTEGNILIAGEDLSKMDKKKLRQTRREKLGMVFQRFALFPHRTILENAELDRKSTRLNSSHVSISYAVFCLKNKKKKT